MVTTMTKWNFMTTKWNIKGSQNFMHGRFCCLTLSGTGQEYLYCRSKGSVLAEDAEDEQLAYLDKYERGWLAICQSRGLTSARSPRQSFREDSKF
jgi:hypothetical protein